MNDDQYIQLMFVSSEALSERQLRLIVYAAEGPRWKYRLYGWWLRLRRAMGQG